MRAGDHGESSEGGMDGEARPVGDRTGRDADADRFEVLFECLRGIGDAGGRARGFLESARWLLRDGAPPVPRRGEVVAYCVRQAADSILESAGSSPEDGRWRELSRKVVSAKKRYERERRFAWGDLAAALAELLAEIDALDTFHKEASTRSERQAAAAHARLTGSYAVREGLEPVREFLRVRDEAASRLHGTCSLDDAERLLSECVDAMLGFLRSTADKSGELAEVAGRASPGSADLEAAQRLIINDSDLEVFLGSAADPAWLDLLYRDGRLDLPRSHSGRWAARTAAIRLSGTHRQQVKAWLETVAEEHRRDSAGCAAVVDVLLSMDGPEFEAALEIAARHPRDRIILSHFGYALDGADPSDPIVDRCADIFLNALTPEDSQAGQTANSGWNRMPGELMAILRMLSDGAGETNATSRIRLLLLKMAKMQLQYGAYSLFPMGRDWRLPITVLCENDFDEYHGEPRHAIGGCLLNILTKAMGLAFCSGAAGADRGSAGWAGRQALHLDPRRRPRRRTRRDGRRDRAGHRVAVPQLRRHRPP